MNQVWNGDDINKDKWVMITDKINNSLELSNTDFRLSNIWHSKYDPYAVYYGISFEDPIRFNNKCCNVYRIDLRSGTINKNQLKSIEWMNLMSITMI